MDYFMCTLTMSFLCGTLIRTSVYGELTSEFQQYAPQFHSGVSVLDSRDAPAPRHPRLIRQKDSYDPYGKSASIKAFSNNYDFEYQIHGGGNFYGHAETRTEKETSGKYYVVLPDFRRQIVEYYVDSSGYHATVSYEPINSVSGADTIKNPTNPELSTRIKSYKRIVRRRIPKRRRSHSTP